MAEEVVNIRIPAEIKDKVEIGPPYENVGSNGKVTSFGIEMRLPALDLKKEVKSRDAATLESKAEDTLRQWATKHKARREKEEARQYKEAREDEAKRRQREIDETFQALEGILSATLTVDDRVDWDRLKSREPFETEPEKVVGRKSIPEWLRFDRSGRPTSFDEPPYPKAPTRDGAKREIHWLKRLLSPSNVDRHFSALKSAHAHAVAEVDETVAQRRQVFDAAVEAFERRKARFEKKQRERNEAVDDLRARYERGEHDAIEEHLDVVLESSSYPDLIPRNWDRQFKPDSGIMIVYVQLPALSDMPDVESVTYNKTRDEVKEKKLPDKRRREIYDDVIYKIVLRTMHEIFEADTIGAVKAATVNGFVDTIDDATGKRTVRTIASVSADKEAFEDVNLARIDPKATFKHFRGVAAAKMADMAAVPPVMEMDKEDKRFIEGQDVAAGLDEGMNVATMSWQDFEYLIRELFHAEFARTGGEVKVTQASSDGGVDAIAFDPDPIRGGKIVIQAKRYTNTVGLSAVRDLYGTVMNEGASSGILVTTSDYGKEAYDFVKDKPLKLLNGSNLLHLLSQHGHNARIDLKDAKRLAKESS